VRGLIEAHREKFFHGSAKITTLVDTILEPLNITVRLFWVDHKHHQHHHSGSYDKTDTNDWKLEVTGSPFMLVSSKSPLFTRTSNVFSNFANCHCKCHKDPISDSEDQQGSSCRSAAPRTVEEGSSSDVEDDSSGDDVEECSDVEVDSSGNDVEECSDVEDDSSGNDVEECSDVEDDSSGDDVEECSDVEVDSSGNDVEECSSSESEDSLE
jgi:hypothetical protein